MTIWNMEITASESPQTVHIPIEGKYYAIKNTGESDILVSSYIANPTDGADDVMKIPSGSAAVIPVKDGDLYVSAEEEGTYSVSIQDDKVIPWDGGTGSGGGDGDNTHYKGTTTTPLENGSTTNPITIVKDDESYTYTAVFGDVVVYGYTEFVFDGTAWSEFGRPFDTEPTQGSTNAVTSDGVYKRTPFARAGSNDTGALLGNGTSTGEHSVAIGTEAKATNKDAFTAGYYTVASGAYSSAFGFVTEATGNYSHAYGNHAKARGKQSCATGFYTTATGDSSFAGGAGTIANKESSTAIGKWNVADTDVAHLLIVGNGTENARSNILEVSETEMNVNGDIKINNIAIPTPYTTMPTITEDMLGQIAMYVGATNNDYIQGRFYVASTDGAAEPTYSWVQIGGGRTETILWENEGTTNPNTITLSEAWSNFDEIVVVTDWIKNNTHIWGYCTLFNTFNTHNIGDIVRLWYYDNDVYSSYTVTSATVLTKYSVVGNNWVHKIIGIKY